MHRFFFWLLLIFLPTQWGYHAWPQWSMVLGRRVDYLSPTLFFTDVLIALTLSFWAISKSKILNPKQIPASPAGRQISKFKTKNIVLCIGCVVFMGTNIFFATSRPVALYHWVKFFEFALLGYYIIQTKPNVSRVTNFVSLSVSYSSAIAIVQFILQHSVGGPLWFLGERAFSVDTPGIARIVIGGKELLRSYATFPHPNVLGGYLAVLLPVIIQSTNNPINKLSNAKKYFYIITFVLGIIALILTFSRSAWIVAGVGIGWVLFGKKRIVIFFALACLLSLIAFTFDPLDESVVIRQQLNAGAVTMFHSSPLFGVGLGNFLTRLPDYLPSRTIYFLQPVHNIYLLLLSEIGVIGVIGVIKGRIKWGIPLVALLLLGLVDHYPFTLQQGRLVLTIVIALSYRVPRLP